MSNRKTIMPQQGNATTNRYGSIAAEIYDIDKPFGALPDTAFYLSLLEGVKGPVLEPACGSGRTLIPLLEAGHEAAGFDPSPEMLDSCRRRCAERGLAPRLSQQSFADFTYDEAFAAIVVPAGSFGLIAEFGAAVATMKRFADHLAQGGRLIVDIQPLAGLAARGEDLRSWTAANGDLLTLEGKVTGVDWQAQTIARRYRYERWRDHDLVESQIDTMVIRHWGREEFALALQECGFRVEAVFGNHARRRPRSSDHSLTFEAQRR